MTVKQSQHMANVRFTHAKRTRRDRLIVGDKAIGQRQFCDRLHPERRRKAIFI
jgi:hypothetical protein